MEENFTIYNIKRKFVFCAWQVPAFLIKYLWLEKKLLLLGIFSLLLAFSTFLNANNTNKGTYLGTIDSYAFNVTCNDNGTPNDPADDVFSFSLVAANDESTAGWNTSIDGSAVSGNYDQIYNLGPYDISDGNLAFTLIDNFDPTTTTDVLIIPPTTCSDTCKTYTIIRTWTATDDCGNETNETQVVEVEDNNAPTLTAFAVDVTFECDGNGNYTDIETWIDSNGGATATDECGNVFWSNDLASLPTNCSKTGNIEVVFTAADLCGNEITSTATLTIIDSASPLVTAVAQDTVVECDGLGNNANVLSWLDNQGGAIFNDGCGGDDLTLTNNYGGGGVPELGACNNDTTNILSVIFTATDDCGNATSTTARFIIIDQSVPTITAVAQDTIVECDGSENLTDLNSWLSNNGGSTATDGCNTAGGFTWSNNYGGGGVPELGACNNDTTNILSVIFTATDDCGNATSTTARFIIIDQSVPTITAVAQDTIVECDGSENLTDLNNWLSNNGGSTATDGCNTAGGFTWSNNYGGGGVPELGACNNDTTNILSVIFTATDDCGNATSTTARFIIIDQSVPTITAVAQDTIVECDGSENLTDLNNWLSNNGGSTATDGCNTAGGFTWSNNYGGGGVPELGACNNDTTNILSVIFTATDDCGNATSTTARFIIIDQSVPTITAVAQDTIVECDGSENLTDLNNWLSNNGGSTATDGCNTAGGFTWSNNYGGGGVPELGACNNDTTNILSVIFTATDDCGNATSTTARFIIIDQSVPTITAVAQDTIVECDGSENLTDLNSWLSNNGGSTATDGCNTAGGFTWSNNYGGGGVPELGACNNDTTNILSVIFTATDDCGNATSTTARFIIIDQSVPTITAVAQDTIVECDGSENLTDLNSWLSNNGGSTATDGCNTAGGFTWSNNYGGGGVPELGACNNDTTNILSVIFTATDDCGNATSTTARFIIIDQSVPTITAVAQDTIVECDGSENLADLNNWLSNNGGSTATDGCNTAGGFTWSNNYGGGGVPELGACNNDTTNILSVIFTATDDCGNATSTTARFIIIDQSVPTITAVAQDTIVECDGSENLIDLNNWLSNNGGSTATDGCNTAGGFTWSNNYGGGGVPELGACNNDTTNILSVIFTATDDCGNATSTTARFIIIDQSVPTITAVAQDTIVECDGSENLADLNSWLSNNGGSTATDGCNTAGGFTWSNNYGGGGVPELGACNNDTTNILSVIFTATDDCGNATSTTARFIIIDQSVPTITAVAQDTIVECDGSENLTDLNSWLSNNGGSTATDGCNTAGGFTWSNNYGGGGVPELGACNNDTTNILSVIFTATDDCGNATSTTARFIIIDQSVPTITAVAQDTIVECDGSENLTDLNNWLSNNGGSTATDGCNTAGGFIWSNNYGGGGVPELGACNNDTTNILSVIFTATDDCGNATSTTARFIIIDQSVPTITAVAQDTIVECDGSENLTDLNNWLSNNGGSTATDGCNTAGGFTWSNNYGGGGVPELGACNNDTTNILSVIFTATDDCGNATSTTARFIIIDQSVPTITAVAQDTIVECDGSENLIDLNNWLSNNGGSTATDGCNTAGGFTWSNNYGGGGVPELGACNNDTTNILSVIFTATDDCGNATSTTARFIIIDQSVPTITAVAQDTIVECDGSENLTDLNNWLSNNGGSTATDGCNTAGGFTWSNNYGGGGVPELGACNNDTTNILSVIFTATDDCGNATSTTARFIIIDQSVPTITAVAQDTIVECDGSENLTDLNNWLSNNGGSTATDGCNTAGGFTWSNNYGGGGVPELGACNNDTTNILSVIFTATDDCGNATSTTARFIIIDQSVPTITAVAQDTIVECDGSENLTDLNNWLSNNGGSTATDGCNTAGGFTWSNNYGGGGVPELGACNNDTTNILSVIFTATDDCGNATSTTARFIIIDQSVPTITAVAQDTIVECDGSENLIDLNNWLSNNGGSTATDGCNTAGGFTWSNNYGGGGVPELGACNNDTTNILSVIFTATDDCGNATSTTARFIIIDQSVPTITAVAQDTIVECDGSENLTDLNNWLSNNGGSTATDGCNTAGGFTWSNNYGGGGVPELGACNNDTTNILSVIFTATDDCGNATSTTARFIIIDQSVPTITAVAQDTAVECNGADNLVELNNWLTNNGGATATDGCNTNGGFIWTNNYDNGGIPTVSGGCNNDTTSILNITFYATDDCGNVDSTMAKFVILDTTAPTITTNLPLTLTAECSYLPPVLLDSIFTDDNCDTDVLVTSNDVRINGPCTDEYTIERTYTATDNCGRTAEFVQTIDVSDNTLPILVSTGVPPTITVDCVEPAGDISQFSATDNCDTDVEITFADVITAGGCVNNYTVTRTYTATDNCGNESTFEQTINVIDNTAPVLVSTGVPSTITADCVEPAGDISQFSATDNCDTDVEITFADVITAGSCVNNYTVTRTYTATDDCGNESTFEQTINVIDNTAPVLVSTGIPSTITVDCVEPAGDISQFSATDNCDTDVEITFADVITAGSCVNNYTVTRTYTATDDCGNESTFEQTINVIDNTAPVLVSTGVPSTITVDCVEPAGDISQFSATDNCDTDVEITFADVITAGSCVNNYTVTRTYTATDDCGNESTFEQTINVIDNTAPVLVSTGVPPTITIDCVEPAGDISQFSATDNCDTDVEITFADVITAGSCVNNYTVTRTYTATDDCGNESTFEQTINVIDNTAPVLVSTGVPSTITVDCVEPAGDISQFSATDNCDTDVEITFADVITAGSCVNNYTVTRTYTATDDCGNESTFEQTINVIDNTVPVLVSTGVPSTITVDCIEPAGDISQFSATDNCDTDVEITFADVITAGSCVNNYTVTRTYTATDDCGNESTFEQTINVIDNTVPVLVSTGVPSIITVDCVEPVGDISQFSATDNCDTDVEITFADVITAGSCVNNYTVTRTYTATDDCGNESTFEQTINVIDNTVPVLVSTGVPSTITVDCIEPAGDISQFSATDNCDTDVEITFADVITAGSCVNNYTVTRTYTATDDCGNESTFEQTINVIDNTAPVLVSTGVPSTITVDCVEPAGDISQFSATDNCDTDVEITFADVITAGSCVNNYTVTRTYTATDDCGNESTFEQTINVIDNTAPVLVSTGVPSTITVDCVEPAGDVSQFSATDNCDTDVEITFADVITAGSCVNNYTVTRTYTATDDCGNESTFEQTINVIDNTAPVLVSTGVPSTITVDCVEPAGDVSQFSATDNCDTDVEITFADVITAGSCVNNYTVTRTYTATDDCGNESTFEQTINVIDNTAPVLVSTGVPSTITADCVEPAGDISQFSATDNCDTDVEITFADVITAGSCVNNYTVTRTYTATDDCGNESTFEQTINVIDNTAPVLVSTGVPSTITADCVEPAGDISQFSATDNCDTDVEITFADVITAGSCVNNYTVTRTYTATDDCGNESTFEQTINVIDNTAPVLVSTGVPSTITVDCVEPAGDISQFSATDNCDTDVEITFVDVITAGSCVNNYTVTRTYTATDDCGNESTFEQTINVIDNTAPVLVSTGVPSTITVDCVEPAGDISQFSATDNCDTDVEITFADVIIVGSCVNNYTVTRTYTATDDCGNESTFEQTINVIDNTAPVLVNTGVPSTITVDCVEPAGDISQFSATDNCDTDVEITFADVITAGSCVNNYTVTRTYTATDDCGNESTFEQTINVIDNTAPVLVSTGVPSTITADCVEPAGDISQFSATDNCDTDVEITFADVITAGSCVNNYTVTRTYTATDDCGNESTFEQTINVIDNTAPVLVSTGVPSTITVDCVEPAGDVSQFSATDNCDTDVEITFADVITAGSCVNNYTVTRTYTATDDCGNESTFEQTINVIDNTAPVLVSTGVPSTITVDCVEPAGDVSQFSATDNCDTDVEITFADVITAGSCVNNYTVTRTYTATDDCGNESTFEQTINVIDNTAPVLVSTGVPSTITVDCVEPAGDVSQFSATDNCDTDVEITFADVITAGSCVNNYTVTRTYTATDDCGNESTFEQTINVIDNTAPVLVSTGVPSTITADCVEPAGDISQFSATDNCDTDVEITFADVITAGSCVNNYTVTRTYTATDDCGNESTFEQTINVIDNTAPVLVSTGVPSTITADCVEPAGDISQFSATDNCDTDVEITFADVITAGSCVNNYTVTRTYTATDDCGNESTFEQTINVIDNTAPVLVSTGVPSTITVDCVEPAGDISQFSATDNCDTDVEITFADVITAGSCVNNYTVIRTYTATDDCGNESTFEQTINVIDNTAPVLVSTGVPTILEADCVEPAGDINQFSATDNCDTDVEITFADVITAGSCVNNYTVTRTYTATDDCGNESTFEQTINVIDNTAPVLVSTGVPSTITADCVEPAGDISQFSATDNCDTDVEITFADVITAGSCVNNYTVTRTYTATDDCGNESTFEQTINVIDNTAPVLVSTGVPSTITADCVEPAGDISQFSATDNCDTDVEITFADVITAGSCVNNYTVTRTYTATDNCGNESTFEQTINVIDNTAPVLVSTGVPSTITADCVEPAGDISQFSATDNCDTDVEITFADVITAGSCVNNYTVTRTYTATDDCGNESTFEQTINVVDNTAPDLTSAGVSSTITVDCIEPAGDISQFSATDNCDTDVEITFADVITAGSCVNNYTVTRTYTATDDCGNESTFEQTINVVDNTAPDLTSAGVSSTITVDCIEPAGDVSQFSATDNCDTDVEITFADVITAGSCVNNYTVTRTYTATDDCGNESTFEQTINVVDNTAPDLTSAGVSSTITVDCIEPAGDISQFSATDNCDTDVEITFTDVITAGSCVNNYTVTRTYTATDDCGNESTFEQTINVIDNTAPVLVSTGVPTILEADCVEPAGDISQFSATDNCDTDVEITFADVITAGSCVNNYTVIRTYTATDDCGNESTFEQTINVIDNTAPVLVSTGVPSTITVDCVEPAGDISQFSATDNCDTDVEITFADVITAGSCVNNYTVTRTYTATDDCGNESTFEQTINVIDNTAPVLVSTGVPTILEADCVEPAGDISQFSATDNCDTDVEVTFADVITAGSCVNNYTVTRTYTATDNCGNESTFEQTINVIDNTAPVLVSTGVPSTITVDCVEPAGDISQFSATDNCDTDVEITFADVITAGSCVNNYIVTRTYTATDDCGNESTFEQTINVVDNTAPDLTSAGVSSTITVDCIEPAGDISQFSATDNCDTDVEITFADVITAGSCVNNYTVTRTYTATDDCGNESTFEQTINVVDNTAPDLTSAGVSSTITVDCIEPAGDISQFSATDNCDTDVEITFADVITAGSCVNNYTVTRTYTATDDCGNESTFEQTINVVDNTAPDLTSAGVSSTITVDCIEPAGDISQFSATDNCDTDVEITFVDVITAGSCVNNYTVTRTYTATDDCGNESTFEQTINVIDNTAPVLVSTGVPTILEADCVEPAGDVSQFSATDNCDTDVEITFADVITAGSCANNYTVTRTYTATDDCGNESTFEQTINVIDNTAPVLVSTGVPTTLEADCIEPAGDISQFSATDNCDTDVEVTFADVITAGSCVNNYTVTRTYTATDNCGNESTFEQTINVIDNTAPVLVSTGVPSTITVDCVEPAGDVSQFSATDNCDTDVEITFADVVTAGSCVNNYTVTRTYTATDNCGNESTFEQTINVVDNTAPDLTSAGVSSTITVDCIEPAGDISQFSATDNCDTDVEITFADVITAGSCVNNYTVTRTYTATDDCGNESTFEQTINVVDNTAPDLTSAGVSSTITVDCIEPAGDISQFSATDNCDTDVEITFADVITAGSCVNNYTVTRTYTATDDCGNESTFEQTINVVDNTAPDLTSAGVSSTITVDCIEPAGDISQFSATDNCDTDVEITFADVITAGSCINNYTVTRTYTATDDCGNESTFEQTINVIDNTAPVLVSTGVPTILEADCVEPAGDVSQFSATDNCDTDVEITFADVITAGSCVNNYTVTRTYTATDDCGNESMFEQTINVIDNTAPVLVSTGVPTILEADCVEPAGDVSQFSATDNCDTDVEITFADVIIAGSCANNYTVTRTYTATDDCGNESTFEQTINVIDNTAPVLVSTGVPTILEADCVEPAGDVSQFSATDNCDTDVEITFADVITAGSCANNYTVTRTYTATDDCGNESTFEQTINVIDNTAPVLVSTGVPTILEADCVEPAGDVSQFSATDNCDTDVEITFADVITAGSCANNYTVTRTYTATDDCGNESTFEQTINVVDNTAPDLASAGVPTTINANCIEPAGDVSQFSATDNCDTDVEITFVDVITAGSCVNNYIVTRTYTATDDCGNESTFEQTINVIDNTAPVITTTLEAVISADCNDIPAPDYTSISATDNCDTDVEITSVDVASIASCPDASTIIRTYTATDDCGNTSTFAQIINVSDTESPVITTTLEATITAECDEDISPDYTAISATDNCDADVEITSADVLNGGDCSSTITRTYTATDNCGNTTEFVQIITIDDSEDPTITTALDAVVSAQCGDDLSPDLTAVTGTDNCDTDVEITSADITTDGDCEDSYVITRTYTATDNCGNTAEFVQVITVDDTQVPTINIPGGAVVTLECSDDLSPDYTAVETTDNCDTDVEVTSADVTTAGSCEDTYTITRTFTAVDNCGNTADFVQIINVEDTQIPTITTTLEPVETAQCGDDVTPDYTAISATDNCDTNVEITSTDAIATGTCPDNYTITRTYTAIDNCGNAATFVQIITVEDTQIPTIATTLEANITAECGEDISPDYTAISATDNCDTDVEITSTDIITAGDCPDASVITRRYIATDNCGNSAEFIQIITIEDTEVPNDYYNITGYCNCNVWRRHLSGLYCD